jgi:hypothetical protein
MMLRYGSLESWSEVAAVSAGSAAAIRMKCRRFLDRIRRELGMRVLRSRLRQRYFTRPERISWTSVNRFSRG